MTSAHRAYSAPGGFSLGIATSSRVKSIMSDREASTASSRLLGWPGTNHYCQMRENLSMHLTIDEFRRLGYRAVDLAAEHLAQVPGGPVYRQMRAEDRARLTELPLPNLPASPDQLLDFIEREILAYPMGNGHPRFLDAQHLHNAFAAARCPPPESM